MPESETCSVFRRVGKTVGWGGGGGGGRDGEGVRCGKTDQLALHVICEK